MSNDSPLPPVSNLTSEAPTKNSPGRPGLALEDVALAMATLESQGRKTSLREIRRVLGRGSNSTIGKLRQRVLADQIREHHAIPENTPESWVHEVVIEVLDKLWNEALEAADARINEHQTQTDRVVQLNEKRTASAREQSALAQARFDTLQAQHTITNDTLQTTVATLDTLRNEYHALKAQIKLNELQYSHALTELHTQNDTLQLALNEAQKQAQQHKQTLEQTQQHRVTLTQERDEAQHSAKQHQDAHTLTLTQLKTLTQQLDEQSATILEQRSKIGEWEQKLVHEQEQRTQIQQQFSDTTRALDKAQSQLEHLHSQRASEQTAHQRESVLWQQRLDQQQQSLQQLQSWIDKLTEREPTMQKHNKTDS